jgi:hypothetical protein
MKKKMTKLTFCYKQITKLCSKDVKSFLLNKQLITGHGQHPIFFKQSGKECKEKTLKKFIPG